MFLFKLADNFGIFAVLRIYIPLDEPSISPIFLFLILIHLLRSISQTNYLTDFLFFLYPYCSRGYIFLLSLNFSDSDGFCGFQKILKKSGIRRGSEDVQVHGDWLRNPTISASAKALFTGDHRKRQNQKSFKSRIGNTPIFFFRMPPVSFYCFNFYNVIWIIWKRNFNHFFIFLNFYHLTYIPGRMIK